MYTIKKITPGDLPEFERLCLQLPAFGAKTLASLRCYGYENPDHRFWMYQKDGVGLCAMEECGGVLIMTGDGSWDRQVLADFIRQREIAEIEASWDEVEALLPLLGGTTDSCWFMDYPSREVPASTGDIRPTEDFPAVFRILQICDPFYGDRYTYEQWEAEEKPMADCGEAQFFLLWADGKPVGTGSVGAMSGGFGTVSSLSVLPEYRRRGFGSNLTRFLSGRILEAGCQPCLIAGSEDVCPIYRGCGFVPTRRWGQLFLR